MQILFVTIAHTSFLRHQIPSGLFLLKLTILFINIFTVSFTLTFSVPQLLTKSHNSLDLNFYFDKQYTHVLCLLSNFLETNIHSHFHITKTNNSLQFIKMYLKSIKELKLVMVIKHGMMVLTMV